jgi:hypothetical protein
MPSRDSIAKKVRLHKERQPELYCVHPRCLWRMRTRTQPDPRRCPKHQPKIKEAE